MAPLQPVVNIIDYSRPLIRTDVIPPVQDLPTDVPVIPQVIDTPPTADEEVLKAKRAAGLALFEQAREAFKNGEYARSEELIDAAIPDLPGDPTPHEFRALVLFARGKYQDAAAAIYAVLSAGPGWNWETLRALYPTVDTYTQHLRTLERYRLEHADRTDASFLLAYHYLTIGELQPATRLLENVVKLNPTDQLSSAILKALTTPKGETDRPKAGG